MEHIAGMLFVLIIIFGFPLIGIYWQRTRANPRNNLLPSGDLIPRLDRIEQAIEAMATEVERIAEGQRWTTKLLSAGDGKAVPAPVPAAPAQASTNKPEPSEGTILVQAARRP